MSWRTLFLQLEHLRLFPVVEAGVALIESKLPHIPPSVKLQNFKLTGHVVWCRNASRSCMGRSVASVPPGSSWPCTRSSDRYSKMGHHYI